jgi:hypothetical protein
MAGAADDRDGKRQLLDKPRGRRKPSSFMRWAVPAVLLGLALLLTLVFAASLFSMLLR